MKIVVLDGYTLNPGDLSWDGLRKLGELTVYDRTESDKIIERIGDAQIVYTNKTFISREILESCPSIKFIGVLATGYNVVDFEAATEKNIPVCNIPTYGTSAVAQFTFALLLEVCHHIGEHSESVRNGDWTVCPDFCFWNFPLIELAGKTFGIIGFGRIGQAVSKIAEAFGLKVLYCDNNRHEEFESDTCQYAALDKLLQESDIISLHCPLFNETANIICEQNIAKMKDGVILLNTSRGPLINEMDLKYALESGKISYAALDVVSSEPIKADNPLINVRNCIITPHIAWAPKESRERLMQIAVENLEQYLKGNTINAVNI